MITIRRIVHPCFYCGFDFTLRWTWVTGEWPVQQHHRWVCPYHTFRFLREIRS